MKKNKHIDDEVIDLRHEKQSGIFFTATILSLLVAMFFVSMLTSLFGGTDEVSGTNWYKILGYAASAFALIMAILFGLRFSGAKIKENFGETKVKPIFFVATAFIFYGMLCGLSEANNLIIELFKHFGYKASETTLPDKTALNVILCVLVICVLPAVFEELIFRGFILNGLKVFGDRTAILISALLFSLYHMNPSQTLYQFIVGALFAFIAVSAKSIIPTIIAHFLNNFIIVVNYYFIGADPHGGLKAFLVITGLIALTVGLVILARECVLEKADKKVDKKAGWKEFALYSCGGIFAALIIWFSCFFA